MSYQGYRALDESDAVDRQTLSDAEELILMIVAQERPETTAELSSLVKDQLRDLDNSTIRGAILRLLNENRLGLAGGQDAPAR
jgi:predicted transcriptional regulator